MTEKKQTINEIGAELEQLVKEFCQKKLGENPISISIHNVDISLMEDGENVELNHNKEKKYSYFVFTKGDVSFFSKHISKEKTS